MLLCIDGPDAGYELDDHPVLILETSGRCTVTEGGPGGYNPDDFPVATAGRRPDQIAGDLQTMRPRVLYGRWRTTAEGIVEYRWILTTWTRKNWTLLDLWNARHETPYLEHAEDLEDVQILSLLNGGQLA